jgi:D-alanine transaminase
MSRIAYVNGRYVPLRDARVGVEDRGFQFADSVYEVCSVRAGALIDEDAHMARLERSLKQLQMRMPMGERQLRVVMRETVRRNRVSDGLVYLQISRGQARRDHGFPADSVMPTLVITARTLPTERYEALAAKGIAVITVPEARWARCDIKSTGLLANVLAKQQAREKGAFESWFVGADGTVTEGSSTNAWIVDSAGTLRTRALSHAILPGVTRGELLPLSRQHGIAFEERAFTVAEAQNAREAFISAASFGVLPVVSIDGKAISGGKPGAFATALRSAYWASRAANG